MKKLRDFFVVVSILVLAVAVPASAQMGKMMERGKSGMKHPGMMGHGMGHPFGSHWKETLTDEQKMQADQMHLALKKAISVPNAQLNVKKAELNKLMVHESPDIKTIHRKIDEILELKRKIMRKKYEHMVEMRGMLTPEQRVSFDMKLVEMAGHKKGRGQQ
jgi:Spy/CpxP family protein refolding chaperone